VNFKTSTIKNGHADVVVYDESAKFPPDDRIVVTVKPHDVVIEKPRLHGNLFAVWRVTKAIGIKGMFRRKFGETIHTTPVRHQAEKMVRAYLQDHPGSEAYIGQVIRPATPTLSELWKLYPFK
jgi:hypothetical protein